MRKILDVNVVGTFNMCRSVAIAMTKNSPDGKYKQRGVIINVSSNSAVEGQNGQSLYAASKAAVNGMTLPMARDLGKHGIRVVCFAPGPINTAMTDSFTPEVRASLEGQSCLGRIGFADEFGDACVGVVNSTYLTGAIIRLDGGIILPKL